MKIIHVRGFSWYSKYHEIAMVINDNAFMAGGGSVRYVPIKE